MNPAIFDKPFFEVTLPLMCTILAGVWAMISTNNRKLDDMGRRIDDMGKRIDDLRDYMNRQFAEVNRQLAEIRETLKEIQATQVSQGNRLTAVEERTSALRR